MAMTTFHAITTLLLFFLALANAFIGSPSTAGRPKSHLQWLASDGSSDVSYFDTQETLLRIHLSTQQHQDTAYESIQRFLQSFQFAVALPSQPLAQLPTKDGGVAVQFFRHGDGGPHGASSLIQPDGGVRFFISQDTHSNKIILTAKRDERGQLAGKLVDEKQLVTALLAALTGNGSTATTWGTLPDTAQVESVYHKWMLENIELPEPWTLHDDAYYS